MIEIYTDGSCKGNPGPGGYAFVAVKEGKLLKGGGAIHKTTNNIMEMMAVVSALEFVVKHFDCSDENILIYTDSKYVVDSINKHWYEKWLLNGWRASTGAKVANKSLWEKILKFRSELDISFIWVRGHNGNQYNEMCDCLAKIYRDKQKR